VEESTLIRWDKVQAEKQTGGCKKANVWNKEKFKKIKSKREERIYEIKIEFGKMLIFYILFFFLF
jgi:hypothetical protein